MKTLRLAILAFAVMAAASVAKYFKENGWKIISFFPNAVCPNRVKKMLHSEDGGEGKEASK